MKKILLLVFVYSLVACAGLSKAPENQDQVFIDKLRSGGYVIFFRHAATDHTRKDSNPDDLSDCDSQRNLTLVGRQQSVTIGEYMRQLEIPVGKVYTSEYCRCVDTARIAFNKAEPVSDLSSIEKVSDMERKRRGQVLRKMLNTPPVWGNTVLVSHYWLFDDATGIKLAEGEAAIMQVNDNGWPTLVRRVKAYDWMKLTSDLKSKKPFRGRRSPGSDS